MSSKKLAAGVAEIVGVAAQVVIEAFELYAAIREEREARELDLFAAELAVHLVPPGSLGDEAAAAQAVHTAKLLIKHAGRDQVMLSIQGGEKPS